MPDLPSADAPDRRPGAAPPERRRRRPFGARLDRLLDSVSGPAPALFAAWLAALVLMAAQSPRLAVLISVGLVGAFVAGLVGTGGAIFIIPLLIYAPAQFGQPALDIHAASGVTMVQVAASSTVAMLAHRRGGHLDVRLALTLGGAVATGSFVGGLVSAITHAALLSGVFASLATMAGFTMLFGRRTVPAVPADGTVSYNRTVAVVIGSAVGLLVGMVGGGGGLLLIPIMVFVLRIPVRVAVGTALAIVAGSGITGAVGKAIGGQVEWLLALALIVGALPGAYLGTRVNRRLPVAVLTRLFGIVILLIAARMWWDLAGG